jgi:hypothetical protein
MKTTLVIVSVLALLVLAGCAQKAMPAASAPTATDSEVSDIGGAVTEIDSLTDDLGTGDLDSLDQELADIESLELQ